MTKALMMIATYTESLLNDRSAPDSHPKVYIGSSPWWLRPIRSHS